MDPGELDAENVDVVVVALPVRLQPGICARYLDMGLAVLTEKPIAGSLAEAQLLRDAPASGERLMVGFLLRYHPAYAALREWASQGDIVAVNVRSVAYKASVEGWRLDRSGGGVIAVNAVHALDLVPNLLGSRPEVECAMTSQGLHGSPVEDYARALLRFGGGIAYALESYWAPFPSRTTLDGSFDLEVDVVATHGRARWNNFRLTTVDREGLIRQTDFGYVDLFRLQAEACVRAWGDAAPMPVGLVDGLDALSLVEEVHRVASSA